LGRRDYLRKAAKIAIPVKLASERATVQDPLINLRG